MINLLIKYEDENFTYYPETNNYISNEYFKNCTRKFSKRHLATETHGIRHNKPAFSDLKLKHSEHLLLEIELFSTKLSVKLSLSLNSKNVFYIAKVSILTNS